MSEAIPHDDPTPAGEPIRTDPIRTDMVIVGAGPVGPVRGVRGRPAQHAVPPGRQPRQDRRPVRRALSGQADLRHPGGAALHRRAADRAAARADPAVRAALPPRASRPSASSAWSDGRWRLTTSEGLVLEAPVVVIAAGAGSFVPRRLPLRRRRGARGPFALLRRAPDGGVPRQGHPDRGRRRFRARLDAQPAAARRAASRWSTGAATSAPRRIRSRAWRSWSRPARIGLHIGQISELHGARPAARRRSRSRARTARRWCPATRCSRSTA